MKLGLLGLALCALVSMRQVTVWQSEIALWAQAVGVSPDLPRPRVNLAAALIKTRQWDPARGHAIYAQTLCADPLRTRERALVQQITDAQLTWIAAYSSSSGF